MRKIIALSVAIVASGFAINANAATRPPPIMTPDQFSNLYQCQEAGSYAADGLLVSNMALSTVYAVTADRTLVINGDSRKAVIAATGERRARLVCAKKAPSNSRISWS